MQPEPLDLAALRDSGYATVVSLPEARSTMDEAHSIARRPEPRLPALVAADRQEAGRGRRGAGWWQAPGSLAASLVVDWPAAGGPPPTWSLACGVALAEVLAELLPGLSPQVRWPNDIEVRGRKLAGILVESVGGRAVFGIGVNTAGRSRDAPEPLRDRIVTVPDLRGAALARTPLLAALLPRLAALVARIAVEPAVLVERYRSWCCLDGREVTVHRGGEVCRGVCRGIAPDGALVLDGPAGPRRIVSGSLTAPADVWRQ